MKKQSLHFSSLVSFSPSHPLPCRGVRVDYVAFLVVLVVKNPPANAGNLRDMGFIRGSGRAPGGGNDNPLQYSCLENPMERGAWWATAHGVAESWTQVRLLSMHAHKSVLFSTESPGPRIVPDTSKRTHSLNDYYLLLFFHWRSKIKGQRHMVWCSYSAHILSSSIIYHSKFLNWASTNTILLLSYPWTSTNPHLRNPISPFLLSIWNLQIFLDKLAETVVLKRMANCCYYRKLKYISLL